MLQFIREYSKYVEITGFKKVKFPDAEAFLKAHRRNARQDLDLQFFDADLIATRDHLQFAVLNALQAFGNGTNISKSLAVETMLFASAQRQIQKAIDRCGIKPQTTRMAATVIGEKPSEIRTLLGEISVCVGSEPDESVLELSDDKRRRIKEIFQVKGEEIEAVMEKENQDNAVVSLIVERVALLATQL
jgi:tRNA threonylcarbamoyladenosine modification (KEOPS) complex Cgi121 subunit